MYENSTNMIMKWFGGNTQNYIILKLDFKVNSFVFSKVTFDKIQVTDIALFGFMDICHVLSQDVCSVESLFTASAL